MIGDLLSVQTRIGNLKTELIAYRDETDPRTFRFILEALTRADLYNGYVDGAVSEHINFREEKR